MPGLHPYSRNRGSACVQGLTVLGRLLWFTCSCSGLTSGARLGGRIQRPTLRLLHINHQRQHHVIRWTKMLAERLSVSLALSLCLSVCLSVAACYFTCRVSSPCTTVLGIWVQLCNTKIWSFTLSSRFCISPSSRIFSVWPASRGKEGKGWTDDKSLQLALYILMGMHHAPGEGAPQYE